jgi:hypothetical protein
MNGSVGNNSKFVMADLTSAGNRPLADFHHNNSWANGETADNSLVVERLGSDVLPRGVISKRLSDMVDA